MRYGYSLLRYPRYYHIHLGLRLSYHLNLSI
nr:MAG TPA: hypothetical protein [Caudoviricetes sp.]